MQPSFINPNWQPKPMFKLGPDSTPQPVKKGGRGGFLTSLISEGGAAGGAALGTAFLPGIGTIAGAGLGAVIGRLTENKIRDDEYNVGSALGEGALSAGLAGIAPLAKGVKGARAASKAGGSLEEAIMGAKAGFSSVPGEKTAKLGSNLVGQARGITPGLGKTSVRNGLSIKDAKSLNTFLDGLGIKQGGAMKQLEQVENLKSTLFSQQSEILANKNVRIPSGMIADIRNEITEKIAKTPGMSLTPQFTDDLAKLSKNKSVKGLNQFRQSLDDLINFNRAATTPDPSIEKLYKALRSAVDSRVAQLSPDLKKVNQTLSKLYDAEGFLQDAAKKAASTSEAGAIGFRIPVLGNRVPGSVTQNARNSLGRTLQGKPVKTALSANSAVTPQVLGRIPGALNGVQAPQNMSMTNPTTDNTMIANTMPPAISNMMGQSYSNGEEMSSDDPFSVENIQENVRTLMQGGATIKDVKEYLDLAGTIAKLKEMNAPKAAKPLSQSQQDRADLISALGMTEDSVNRGSINFGPIGSRVEGIKSMFNAADPETLSYKNTVSGLRAAITKARAGASLTEGELKLLEKYTPSDTDSEQVVRSKLAALRQLYGNQAPTEGNAMSLEDVLMQYQ